VTGTGRRAEVVLFDVFGTLVTYEPDRTQLAYPRSHQLATETFGLDLTHDRFVAEWDRASAALEATSAEDGREFSMVDAAHAFVMQCGVRTDPAACRPLAETFVREWERHVVAVPGLAPMLRRLAERHRLGIVSNTHDRAMVPRLLGTLAVADAFELVLLSVDHGFRKPHPSIYRAALDHFGVPTAVFVGDSYDADYDGPCRAGMTALLVDPEARWPVPPGDRLTSVLDVEARLVARS
jgi:putative hydrolase of the HAD superfamily